MAHPLLYFTLISQIRETVFLSFSIFLQKESLGHLACQVWQAIIPLFNSPNVAVFAQTPNNFSKFKVLITNFFTSPSGVLFSKFWKSSCTNCNCYGWPSKRMKNQLRPKVLTAIFGDPFDLPEKQLVLIKSGAKCLPPPALAIEFSN